VGGEAAPAPLVLQLVEDVLAVGAITVELGDRERLRVERSNEYGVFVDRHLLVDFREAQLQLVRVVAPARHSAVLLQPAPQHDDAPVPAPAHQPQRLLLALPALAGIAPAAPGKDSLDQITSRTSGALGLA
jgi:hypothetical protein